MTTYLCGNEHRREAMRASGQLNGIDFLEVVDGPGVPETDRQRLLYVHLVNPPSAALAAIGPANVVIEGGVRVARIRVTAVAWSGHVLTVRVDRPGDFSVYRLRLTTTGGTPLPGVDPLLSEIEFSFKVDCPSDFDCAVAEVCPPAVDDPPEIDYLARDFESFRQLMVDRLATLMPGWGERNPADLAMVLVEALAYSADHLSYQLDATAMESTLARARRRTSVRRHARLVDHRTHDGANARTWVQVRVKPGQAGIALPAGTQLLTRVPGQGPLLPPGGPAHRAALEAGPVAFETMHDAVLDAGRNELRFYTWGNDECCLPAGAVSATLTGHPPLARGDVVVFVERLGPRTGEAADADPAHRHPVRLTGVAFTHDPLGGQFSDPVSNDPVPVTEIAWDVADAPPFPLCLSARADDRLIGDVSIALGNMVLADHGRTLTVPASGTVPPPDPRLTLPAPPTPACAPAEPRPRPARFGLTVPQPDLTMGGTIGRALPDGDPRTWAPFDPAGPAASALRWEPHHVLPRAVLDDRGGRSWHPVRDLLASGPFQREFVAEVEVDGVARLRFGDGEYGARPPAGTVFDLTFRRGNGPGGNIGADSLAHIAASDARLEAVGNPLPARGGASPEALKRTRQDAPEAFKIQARAVTPQDYAEMAGRHPDVQRAMASERHTGSWYTIFLSIDRRGGLPVDRAFEVALRAFLERYRLAGHDLEISGPRFVVLEVVLRVCARPEYYRADVARAVLEALGRGEEADGRRGFFHPDNFTFGQPVILSALLAAAQAVEGVHFVEPVTFRRLGEARSDARRAGEVAIGRLEIARLDNDPNFAERGTLRVQMEGGR